MSTKRWNSELGIHESVLPIQNSTAGWTEVDVGVWTPEFVVSGAPGAVPSAQQPGACPRLSS